MMVTTPTSLFRHFTAFRSASEEVADATRKDGLAGEGSHMHAETGRIVQTLDADKPYKVIFDHLEGPETEQACDSIREGEAIIRRNTPTPPPRNTSRDHEGTA